MRRAFFSPVVIHFSVVFFLSAIALVPGHRTIFFTVVIGGRALAGLTVSLFTAIQLMRHN